jgi:phosphatidylinositol alpha-1,6-mannosyltransferase
VTHLLVTNDFPPKVGGIQVYLWELWRRMDPATYAVLTASSHPDATGFDAECATAGIRVERVNEGVLWPTPGLARRIDAMADSIGADLVVLDPALPLGLVGPQLRHPYAVLLHGAEVTVPGRLPVTQQLLNRVLKQARLLISAGGYPAAEAGRSMRGRGLPPVVNVPPGVDLARFRPLGREARDEVRQRLGLGGPGPLVVSVSRLVPRKGMDVLIRASALLRKDVPDLSVAIAGKGREAEHLGRLVDELGAPVKMLGSVSDEDLPQLVAAADLFAMLCRNRWLGLEQEGFGIVFLEAAAAGVPQVAGRSGGAHEAVEDGVTGRLVDRPDSPEDVARVIGDLLEDPGALSAMGRAGRDRVEASFDYDVLAPRLAEALQGVGHW